jgi:carboxyl-terminal processing protease
VPEKETGGAEKTSEVTTEAASGLASEEANPEAEEAWASQRKESFDIVWNTVNEGYFDANFGGVNWAEVRTRYVPQLDAAEDLGALRRVLAGMLGEMGRSHFAIIPHETTVFRPVDQNRIGTVGLEVEVLESEVVVTRVEADSPADGLVAPGDVIRALAEYPVKTWLAWMDDAGVETAKRNQFLRSWVESWLKAPVGTAVGLQIQRGDAEPVDVALESVAHPGDWSAPIGNFPSQPLQLEALSAQSGGAAYLRFNTFAPHLMKQIRSFLVGLSEQDGLILDLRGNPGGLTQMVAGIGGLLVDQPMTFGEMHLRQGMLPIRVYPQAKAFRGKLAVLIDGGSASTSEILAGGLKDVNRARLFGHTTAGAALPSSFKQLPTGDLFQFAIADLRRPSGLVIEGQGVEPDVIIDRNKESLAEVEDPVRAAAEAWLHDGMTGDEKRKEPK